MSSVKQTYPVDQRPIPALYQKRKLPQHSTQKSVLEYEGIWRRDLKLEPQQADLSLVPSVL